MANGTDIAADAPATAGQARKFEAFVREHREGLVHFLRHRVVNDADAQDAAQESFTRLLRYVESQPLAAWKPLLYRIAANVAHDQARKQVTRNGNGQVPLDSDELISDQPSHEQMIAWDQELAMIHDVIMALPPKCRQVFLLQRLRGMSYAAIAKHCGISRKTVEMHISRALSALREAARACHEAP